jgi:hypothetical protein
MLDSKQLPWRKILTEGMVIVVSILLAFAIDAWWNERIERQQEREHLVSMKEEFRSSIEGLQEVLLSVQTHAQNIEQLIVQLKTVEQGASIVVGEDIMGSVNIWRTTDVSTSTLTALMSSGSLNMLSNSDLRAELAGLPASIFDMTEDEVIAQEFSEKVMSAYLVDMGLAEIIYANRGNHPGLTDILPTAPAEIEVKHTQKLIDLLSIKRLHLWFSETTIPLIITKLEALISLINQELNH